MLELMDQELNALIGQAKNVLGFDTQETQLLRDAFAGIKDRAEYQMNKWSHRIPMCNGFSRIAGVANFYYDEL